MRDLLTWPQQLATAGTAGASRFELGHEPYFVLEVDGKRMVNMKAREMHGFVTANQNPSYDASVWRADIEGGIGIVPTLDLYLIGHEAALFARQQFQRRSTVKFYGGYADVSGPYRERLLFVGEVIKARQKPAYPIEVSVHCQGLSGRMAQPYFGEPPEEVSNPMQFIESRLAARGLKTNFTGEPVDLSWENILAADLADPKPALIDYINAFSEAHGLYWTDNGDGWVYFHLPANRFNYLEQPPINWTLRQRGLVTEPDIAAPLQQWDVEALYVDTPSKVSVLWFKPNARVDEAELIEFPIPGGNPDIPGITRNVTAKTRGQVEQFAKAYTDDVLWQTIKGDWSTGSIGVPVLAFDYIKATHGPAGMMEIYDRDMVVTRYHHTFDHTAWHSKGSVRAVFEG